DGALSTAGDDQDVGDPGVHGLLHHVLDGGLVDEREHLLGRGLRRGQEPRPEPRGGDDRLPDLRHATPFPGSTAPASSGVEVYPTASRALTLAAANVSPVDTATAKDALRERM